MNRRHFLRTTIGATCAAGLLRAKALEGGYSWYKGNLHTHTCWSDGRQFPEWVAAWYKEHDYNFLALTDHNILIEPPVSNIRVGHDSEWFVLDGDEAWKTPGSHVWRNYSQAALDATIEKFGADNVEINDQDHVRLKWQPELSGIESPGEFILLRGSELTDGRSHVNAINLVERIPNHGSGSNRHKLLENQRSIAAQEASSGVPILSFACHPNWQWSFSAADLAAIEGDPFFELYNGSRRANHLGDASRPGMEQSWDIANHQRLAKTNRVPLMGLATDDSHTHDFSGRSNPGRGWVQVKASELSAEALIGAMRKGDFYASTGVELEDVVYDTDDRRLELNIKAIPGETYVTKFIGARYGSDEPGIVFAEIEGLEPSYELKGDELYVRATVTSSAEHHDPSFDGQLKQAWTQPVGWAEHQGLGLSRLRIR